MKAIPTEKFAATIVCALAIASFGVVPRVNANPVFPPQHLAAEVDFAVADPAQAELASPSWYRAAPVPPVATRITTTGDNVVASVDVQPWYRATN